MTTVISIHDNNDGTYTFVFSEPVTVTGSPSTEGNMQGWTTSLNNADCFQTTTDGTSTTITFETVNNTIGLSNSVFLAQPTTLTAAHPFQLATGVNPIT